LCSSIAQDRLDILALISIENKAARQLDLEEVVDKFAHSSLRQQESCAIAKMTARCALVK